MLVVLAGGHVPALAELRIILLPLIILHTYINASIIDHTFKKELVEKRTWGSWGNVIRKERNGEKAYEDLIISIHPNVNEELAEKLIPAIKETITEFSKALYTATKNTQYMRKMYIKIPYAWNNVPFDEHAKINSESSDIRVASPVFPYFDQPYNRRIGGCGVSGLFIHLTPAFILKHHKACQWRPRGLLMVREWAKYRWGVYDEIGYPNDEHYPLYIIGNKGYQLNTCMPGDIKGKYIDVSNGNICSKYDITYQTFKNTSCRWYPSNSEEVVTSLMSLPAIRNKDSSFTENVKQLCDENSEHDHGHGKTEQDKNCHSSIWETMQMHSDFSDTTYVKYRDPEFSVVRGINPTYLLVIDWSKSMGEGEEDNLPRLSRKEKVKKYLSNWLFYELFDNTTVGIVLFSDNAKVIFEMKEIKEEEDRKNIIKSYTSNEMGGTTCIGCGVKLAVTNLMGIKNAHIILMTDGEQNTGISIQDVEDELVQSGIPLHSIAIGDAADKDIEGMAMKTGGLSYMLSDEDVGYDLMLALLKIQGYAEVRELPEVVHLSVESPQGPVNQVHWSISESQAGNDMHFRITADNHSRVKKGTKITFPNGTVQDIGKKKKIKYTNTDYLYTYDTVLRDVQPGMYFSNTKLNTRKKNELVLTGISLTRTTTNKKKWQPVKLSAWVSSGARTIDPCSSDMIEHPVIIYCDITVDNSPVIGAQVLSRITHPCPSAEDKSKICKSRMPATGIFLRDNGISPDEAKNDGIYSAYFTRYTAVGRYSVGVHVTSNNNTKIDDGRYDFSPSDIEYEQEPISKECKHKEYIGGSRLPTKEGKRIAIEKSIIGGMIKTVEKSQLTCELNKIQYPPAKITDLTVKLKNNEKKLYLSWTAPGSDYFDNGRVDDYELRYGMNEHELQDDDLKGTTIVDITKELRDQNKKVLVYPGWKAELHEIDAEWMECNIAYYIIIKAIDSDLLKSATSNAAAVMLKCPLKPEDFHLHIQPIQNNNEVRLQLTWIVPTKVFEYRLWFSKIFVNGKYEYAKYINATEIIKEDIYKYKPGDNATVITEPLSYLPVNELIYGAYHITYFEGRDNMLSNTASFMIGNVTIIEDLHILSVLPVDLGGLYQINLTWTVPEEVSKYQLYITEDATLYHKNSKDLHGITIENSQLYINTERKAQFLTNPMKLEKVEKAYAWLLVYYYNDALHRKSNLAFSLATKSPEKVTDFAVMVQPSVHDQKYKLHLSWTAPKFSHSYDVRYGIGDNAEFETWERIKVPMLDKTTIKEPGDIINIESTLMNLSSDVEYGVILKVNHFDGLKSIFSNVDFFQAMEMPSVIDDFKAEPISDISSNEYKMALEWTVPRDEHLSAEDIKIAADRQYHRHPIINETKGILNRTDLTEPFDDNEEYDDDEDEEDEDEENEDEKNEIDFHQIINETKGILDRSGLTEPFDDNEDYDDDEDEEDEDEENEDEKNEDDFHQLINETKGTLDRTGLTEPFGDNEDYDDDEDEENEDEEGEDEDDEIKKVEKVDDEENYEDKKNGEERDGDINNFMKKAVVEDLYEEDNELDNNEVKDSTEDEIVENVNEDIACDETEEEEDDKEEEDDNEDNYEEKHRIRINSTCSLVLL